MKTFLQYINEDIELVSGTPRTTKSDMRNSQRDFEDDAEFRKLLGKIHKDYSIHRSGRNFFITHDASDQVVGQFHTERMGDDKTIKIAQLNIDMGHTKKKIGHSLAVAAYKHLHKTGYTIHSDSQQSVGGASVWRELMNDPSTKKDVIAVHRSSDQTTELGPASELHTGDIWTSDSREARTAGRKKGIKMHKYSTPEAKRAEGVRLVLRASSGVSQRKTEKEREGLETAEHERQERNGRDLEPLGRKGKKPGEMWKTNSGMIGAKNISGKIRYFDDKRKAINFAKSR